MSGFFETVIGGFFSNNTQIERIKADLDNKRENHPDYIKDDSILNKLIVLFDGKVGAQYTDDELESLYKEADKRYKEKIAPGFEDDGKKEGNKKYGDFLLWKQTLEKAKKGNTPIILVTDDRKDDWWQRVSGRTIGPLPQLVREMRNVSGVDFYMYQSDPFLIQSAKFLEAPSDKEIQVAVKEIREVRDEYEKSVSSEDYFLKAVNEYQKRYLKSKFEDMEELKKLYSIGVPERLFQDNISDPFLTLYNKKYIDLIDSKYRFKKEIEAESSFNKQLEELDLANEEKDYLRQLIKKKNKKDNDEEH